MIAKDRERWAGGRAGIAPTGAACALDLHETSGSVNSNRQNQTRSSAVPEKVAMAKTLDVERARTIEWPGASRVFGKAGSESWLVAEVVPVERH
jgi:hypothetical protein